MGCRLETGLTGTDRLHIRRNYLRVMHSDQHWFTGLGAGAALPVMLSHFTFGRKGCASQDLQCDGACWDWQQMGIKRRRTLLR